MAAAALGYLALGWLLVLPREERQELADRFLGRFLGRRPGVRPAASPETP
jgi:hypothetical protein